MNRPSAPGFVRGTAVVDRETAGRILLLDRDGVINVNHGYVHTVQQTDWVSGIFELCAVARDADYRLIVVTNQAGIARGFYSESEFEDYTRWMHHEFDTRGVPLVGTYYCPHHPEAGTGEYLVDCNCRKPRPGMLLAALKDWGGEAALSCLIGDKASDLEAAAAAGIGRSWQVGIEGGLSLADVCDALLAE